MNQGDAQALLQLAQQLQHLGLHRYVQRRYRLVGHQHLQRQRARDAHALALAAGELIGVAVEGGWLQPHQRQQFARRASAAACGTPLARGHR